MERQRRREEHERETIADTVKKKEPTGFHRFSMVF